MRLLSHFKANKVLHQHAVDMQKQADHIHDLTHKKGSIAHIHTQVKQLHTLFHHVEEHVKDLKGPATALMHIRKAMKDLQKPLEHLRKDLGV